VAIIAARSVASSQMMEVVVVKCWLVVPQRYRNLGFGSLTQYVSDTDRETSDDG